MSIFPGQCSSGEDLLRGSQSLPCTLMPALCLMPDQPWTRGIEEGGILFLVTLCRLALFSPSAHPREQGMWQRCGRTLQALDDLAQRGCLEAGDSWAISLSVQGMVGLPASQAWALPESLALKSRSSRQMPPCSPTAAPDTMGAPEPRCDSTCVCWVGVISPSLPGQNPRMGPGCCGDQLQKS